MRWAGLLLLGFVTACGGDSGGGIEPPDDVSIAGNWTFAESMTDRVHQISCTSQGNITISQSGRQFSGNYTQEGVCTGPGGAIDGSGSGSVTGGQIDGDRVSFQAGSCDYAGSASGNPVNRLEGTSNCVLEEAGVRYSFTGNWQAGR